MKTRDVRDLALKLFGLYCGIRFVYAFSQSVVSCMSILGQPRSVMEQMSQIPSPPFFVMFMFLPPVLYFVLTYFFLFRTSGVAALLWSHQPQEESPETQAEATPMAFWIALIGIFFLVQSAGGLVSQLWILATRREMFGVSYLSIKDIPHIVTFPVSILVIVKAKAIERFIWKRQ